MGWWRRNGFGLVERKVEQNERQHDERKIDYLYRWARIATDFGILVAQKDEREQCDDRKGRAERTRGRWPELTEIVAHGHEELRREDEQVKPAERAEHEHHDQAGAQHGNAASGRREQLAR